MYMPTIHITGDQVTTDLVYLENEERAEGKGQGHWGGSVKIVCGASVRENESILMKPRRG